MNNLLLEYAEENERLQAIIRILTTLLLRYMTQEEIEKVLA